MREWQSRKRRSRSKGRLSRRFRAQCSAFRSTTETSGVGTRIEIPSSFPFTSGMTSAVAFAAPVVVGIIESAAARARLIVRQWVALVGRHRLFTTLLAAETFYFTLKLYGAVQLHPIGLSGLTFAQLLLPLGAMALVQYVVNGLLVATLHALKRRRSISPTLSVISRS